MKSVKLVLALAIVVGFFVGCGGDSDSDSEPSSTGVSIGQGNISDGSSSNTSSMSYVAGKYRITGTAVVVGISGKTTNEKIQDDTYITYSFENGVLKGGHVAQAILGIKKNMLITSDSGDKLTLKSDGSYSGTRTLKGTLRSNGADTTVNLSESGKFTKDGVSGKSLVTMIATNGYVSVSSTISSDFYSISKSQ